MKLIGGFAESVISKELKLPGSATARKVHFTFLQLGFNSVTSRRQRSLQIPRGNFPKTQGLNTEA